MKIYPATTSTDVLQADVGNRRYCLFDDAELAESNQPVAWAIFTDAGTVQIWFGDKESALRFANVHSINDDLLTPLCKAPALTMAARAVLAERSRQVNVKGWDYAHDDAHPNGEIAAFAAVYAMPEAAREWPAEETGYGSTFAEALCPRDWVPKFGDRRRDLVKAAALVIAEIERLDRAGQGATHD
jgi:hypothetical protein